MSETHSKLRDLRLTIDNFALLARMESVLSGRKTRYPFNVKEQAKFTQHQITLYLANFCRKEGASPSGGAVEARDDGEPTTVVFVDY